jgi:DNA polymerase III subunit chi
MTRVDFYVLSAKAVDARLTTVCRVSEKAWRQGFKVMICTGDAKQAESMDRMLWTFRDDSFVPHERWSEGDQDASQAPILITCGSAPPQVADVWVNLGRTPLAIEGRNRIAEIVGTDAEAKQMARDRYRHYRQLNCELHTHEL